MFELIFGLFWCAFTGLMTFLFYGLDTPVTVNGTLVEHEAFVQMLWPKLLFGLFWAVGLIVLCIGIYKLVRNARTAMHGEETYGMVVDITPTNVSINNRPVMQAEVAVMTEGEIRILAESIGTDRYKYDAGDFLHVKCYKNDINILAKVERAEVPYNQLAALEAKYGSNIKQQHYTVPDYTNNDEYITINGQRYRKVE